MTSPGVTGTPNIFFLLRIYIRKMKTYVKHVASCGHFGNIFLKRWYYPPKILKFDIFTILKIRNIFCFNPTGSHFFGICICTELDRHPSSNPSNCTTLYYNVLQCTLLYHIIQSFIVLY